MGILEAIFWIILGGSVLIIGGNLFVRGSAKLAELFRVPPLIIGLTIAAIGTSAPELAVSLTGALTGSGNSDIAVGNVVGSNIGNILLILGISALTKPIQVSARLIKREWPLLVLISALFWLLGTGTVPADASGAITGTIAGTADGAAAEAMGHYFPRWGGILFLAILVLYNIWVIRSVQKGDHPQQSAEIEKNFPAKTARKTWKAVPVPAVLLIGGLAMILFGSSRFVAGSVALAQNIGISELVISLTVLAVGTSLPELTVSLIAGFQGKNDLAIGNIVGSNIFNLLGILGVVSVVKPGITALSDDAFWIDMPILVLVTLIAAIFCTTGRKLSRIEGGLLLTAYAGYIWLLLTR